MGGVVSGEAAGRRGNKYKGVASMLPARISTEI